MTGPATLTRATSDELNTLTREALAVYEASPKSFADWKRMHEATSPILDEMERRYAESIAALGRDIEALFGAVGEDIDGHLAPGGAETVAFANGRMKREGDPAVEQGADWREATLRAVAEQFPDAAQRRLHWRTRPRHEQRGDRQIVYCRLAADEMAGAV